MRNLIAAWVGSLHALDRKLARDALRLWGQLIAAALVMASGVAVLVMAHFLFETLSRTQDAYYERERFADVFAHATRAPERLGDEIRAIPGVRAAELRIKAQVQLDLEAHVEPAQATLVSLPRWREPTVNALVLDRGRLLDPARTDEIILSKKFAAANKLEPGDAITAVLNGRKRELSIVGIGQSPEFIYVIAPGDFIPLPERYGVAWMQRQALEKAFDLDGAFTDVALKLSPEADIDAVIDELDALLEPYGGTGAYPREDQTAAAYFQSEIDSLVSMGSTIPPVFLIVSAFMLYVLLVRLIETEREQIGLMKAFGYSDVEVLAHYMKLAAAVGLSGGLLGAVLGVWAGRALSGVYTEFYSLPFMILGAPGATIGLGVVVAVATACAGAFLAARRAMALAPAEAMRPPAPARFRKGLADVSGIARLLTAPSRIIVRNIERRPVRALLTTLGVAAGCATIIGTTFTFDSMVELTEVQFFLSQRQDVTLSLTYPREDAILNEVARLPGVIKVEGVRAAPVEAVKGPLTERTAIQGIVHDAELQRPLDKNGQALDLPPEGIILSRFLAEKLGAAVGETMTLKVLDGKRPTLRLPLAAVADDYVGVAAYMRRDALNRALDEGPTITSAVVTIDPSRREAFFAAVKKSPLIQGAAVKEHTVEEIRATMQENVLIFTTMFSLFAGSICFGVVYNAARIALSERGRELASLRVLGFTKGEVAYVLLGELGVLVLAALPAGCLLGFAMAALITTFFDADLFRIPLVVAKSRYAWAILFTVGFAILSGLIVRRRIERLDLVEVLKTRE